MESKSNVFADFVNCLRIASMKLKYKDVFYINFKSTFNLVLCVRGLFLNN